MTSELQALAAGMSSSEPCHLSVTSPDEQPCFSRDGISPAFSVLLSVRDLHRDASFERRYVSALLLSRQAARDVLLMKAGIRSSLFVARGLVEQELVRSERRFRGMASRRAIQWVPN